MLFTALAGKEHAAQPGRRTDSAAQTAKLKKAERAALDDFVKAYATVLHTREGRQVVWELMAECGVFREDYEDGPKFHYNAGRRSIGLRVLATLNGSFPAEFVQMQREAWSRAGVAEAVIAEATESSEGDE